MVKFATVSPLVCVRLCFGTYLRVVEGWNWVERTLVLFLYIVFLFVSQEHDSRNPQPGMILSTHVSSSKGGGTKSLEGLNLSLSERYVG